MSGSINFARGGRFLFDVAISERGWLLSVMEAVEEPLTTEGVDGTRFRLVYDQHPVQTLRTLTACADFAAAAALAGAQKTSMRTGRMAGISIATGSAVVSLSNVHMLTCVPVPIPGPVAGASVGMLASLLTTWTLQLTDAS